MIQSRYLTPVAVGASLALAGCSNTADQTYLERLAAANGFISDVDSRVDVPITSLPTSATYSGVATFEHDNDVGPGETDFVGDVQMNVDFGAETLDGAVSNVVDENDVSYAGSLDLLVDNDANSSTNFFTIGDNTTFIGAVDGALTAGPNQLVVTDGQISGNFGGATAQDVSGFFSGDSTFNGEAGDVSGDWAATQSTVTP